MRPIPRWQYDEMKHCGVDYADPDYKLQADSLRYDRVSGFGEAFGHVIIEDRKNATVARGPRGVYNRVTGEAYIVEGATMVLGEGEGPKTFVDSEELRLDKDTQIVRAKGRVRIERGKTVAEGDSAFVDDANKVLKLRGRPRVSQGRAYITGRDIDVYFGEKEIEKVVVRRNARMVQSRIDTLLIADANEVRGDSAEIFFENGDLKRAVVAGRARSTFVPEETQANRISLNRASGDSILMIFNADDVEEVIFMGHASGTYRFYEGDIDSLKKPKPVVFDSTFGVVRGDTTRFRFEERAETIEYQAERILYMTTINDMHMDEAAEVRYQGRTLKAGRIIFDADTDTLEAFDHPVLLENSDRVYGEMMGYDMAAQQAWVDGGATEYDAGYYSGEKIVRRPDGTLLVHNGVYSSCNLKEPHYGFHSKQMKIYLKDKAVGRPVILRIGNVPVFYLPFFWNSVDPGRRSGFLQPDVAIGVGERSRYIRGLDYYWAASNHWDVLFSGEYNERSKTDRSSVGRVLADTAASRNVKLSTNLRYKWLYKMQGNLNYTMSRDLDSEKRFLTMSGSHDQDISDRMKLRGQLDYASNNQAVRNNNNNTNFERARQRQLTSNLTFSRNADWTNVSATVQRRQIVTPDASFVNGSPILTQTMPNLTLSFRSIRLAPRAANARRANPLRNFLSELQFRPTLNMQRQLTDTVRSQLLDGNGNVVSDTTGVDSLALDVYQHRVETINASTGIGFSRQSHLWIFNVNPNASWSQAYSVVSNSVDTADQDLLDRINSGVPIVSRGTGVSLKSNDTNTTSVSMGIATSTAFYGIFHPQVGALRALRHTIEPRANYAFRPAISAGQNVSHSVNVSLSNRLDLKYDSNGQEVRRDGVIDWQLSSSWNPDRALQWSNVNSSLTLNRQGPLRVTVAQVYDPNQGKIISTSIPFSLRLKGSIPGYSAPDPPGDLNLVAEEEGETFAYDDSLEGRNGRWGFEPEATGAFDDIQDLEVGAEGGLGWDIALTYSLNRVLGETLSSRVGIGFNIHPTTNWRITYRVNYDASTRAFTNPAIQVERALHCWKMSFARVYDGFQGEWRYYFRINIVQHSEDLFFESGDRSHQFNF